MEWSAVLPHDSNFQSGALQLVHIFAMGFAPLLTIQEQHISSLRLGHLHLIEMFLNIIACKLHVLGAYQPEGYEWVDELCRVLSGNVSYACDFIKEHFHGVTLSRPQGTYMLFLDCEEWCKTHGKTIDEVLKAGWDVGVAWQDGRPFFAPYGIRVNLALPLSRVQEAFERLKKYVFVEEK